MVDGRCDAKWSLTFFELLCFYIKSKHSWSILMDIIFIDHIDGLGEMKKGPPDPRRLAVSRFVVGVSF